VFDNKECLIMDKLKKNAVSEIGGMIVDRIFQLTFASSESHSLKATKTMPNKLWHSRMGHLIFKNLVLMRNTNMVNSLPYIEVGVGFVKDAYQGRDTIRASRI
jgi:hypothetical protein